MLALVFGYRWHEPMRAALDRLARWKAEYGYGFSAVLAALAGAVLPEVLKVLLAQRGKIRADNWRTLVFTMPFWGVLGIAVDALYRGQDRWFGSTPALAVLVKKVLVDQFLYNPLFAAPVTVWAYEWRRRRFVWRGLGEMFTPGFYRVRVLPTLVATWAVWIPLVSLIYSLPALLQIPLFGLALSFWALLVATMTASEPVTPTPGTLNSVNGPGSV